MHGILCWLLYLLPGRRRSSSACWRSTAVTSGPARVREPDVPSLSCRPDETVGAVPLIGWMAGEIRKAKMTESFLTVLVGLDGVLFDGMGLR